MQLYRTGMGMAAVLQNDDSELLPLEKFLFRLMCKVGPYRRAVRERWLFGRAATLELYKEGFKDFLVLGAGIPTSGHTHQIVGKECKVLYVDKDESVVKEGTRLLADFPTARYVRGDILKWEETILPHCVEWLGESPQVGIIMVGLVPFLNSEQLSRVLKKMYEWAGEGSALILTHPSLSSIREHYNSLLMRLRYSIIAAIYALTGNRLYLRTNEELEEQARPWRVEKAEPFWGWLPKEEGASESAELYWGVKLRK